MDENEKKRIRLSLRVKKDSKISTNPANAVSVNNLVVLQPKCSSAQSAGSSFVLDQRSAVGVSNNSVKANVQSWSNWLSLPDLTQKAEKITAVNGEKEFIFTLSTTTEWTPLPPPCRKCFRQKRLRQSAHSGTAKLSSVIEKATQNQNQNIDDSSLLRPKAIHRAGMSGKLGAPSTAEQTCAQLELRSADENFVSAGTESSSFSGQGYGPLLDKLRADCHSALLSVSDPLPMENLTNSAARAVAESETTRLDGSSRSVHGIHVVTGTSRNSAAVQATKVHVPITCQPTASVSQIPPKAKLKPLFRNTSIDTMLKPSSVNPTVNNNIVQKSENLKCVRGQPQLQRCPLCNMLFDTRTSQAERTAHISACIVVDDDVVW